MLLFLSAFGWAAQDVVSAVHGVITKLDEGTKTIVVKTADGAERTFKFVAKTAVHGTEAGAKDTCTLHREGDRKTAVEVDKVGKDGLKATEGTITHIDRGTKTIGVKTADGTEETFKLSGHAAEDAGKGIAEGSEKGAKVTVYYTEDAGKKVAHFFEKV